MKDFGFIRTAAAVPVVKVADTKANTKEICKMISEAVEMQVSVVVFPELCITGYSCGDLFSQKLLISSAEKAVEEIVKFTEGKVITTVVGVPVRINSRLFNCAAVIHNGEILGIVPKVHIPNSKEFYEARWFTSGDELSGSYEQIEYAGQMVDVSPELLFQIASKETVATMGVEICEDLWTAIPPSSFHALSGAQLIVNLSASNDVIGKHRYRKQLVSQQSSKAICGYIYVSAGYGESTQDVVFSGSAIIAENGTILSDGKRFQMESSLTIADIDIQNLETFRENSNTFVPVKRQKAQDERFNRSELTVAPVPAADTDFAKWVYRIIDPHPFTPKEESLDDICEEVIAIQSQGLAARLQHINCQTAVIGISGGLDSTLALLVTAIAFDKLGWSRDRIITVTMPGYGTSGRTKNNAMELMEALGTTIREISIVAACDQHFKDLGHDKNIHDVTFENSQARERTQILMDIANQTGGIVVGTGDLSELALGWATYNGDHMSMYGVNASVPKTLVRHLVTWAAKNQFSQVGNILLDIVDTPVSPELLPTDENDQIQQVTEDVVGPYELHDFFLYNFFRYGYSPAKILFLAEKAFQGIYDKETIKKWLNKFIWRFFSQQFKRSCLPDGPKVGAVSLSPRGDWRMPSDATCSIWIEDLENA
jgi:NAD+ synthase (glutamine-hydrolysing)